MCHYAAQLTLPVPAVMVVTLFDPTVAVLPVKPAPIVIVKVAGYLRITIPEPPEPAGPPVFLFPLPPPPEPVFTAPDVASTAVAPFPPPPRPPSP
jgi:hypothetical protein